MRDAHAFAVSDLHGHLKTFVALLKKIQLTPDDTLYIIGDVLDRGPDSKGVIDLILRLQSEAFDIRVVAGNHDRMAYLAATSGVHEDLLEWLEAGGAEETLRSYGIAHPKDIPVQHLRFLGSLPLYRVTERCVFVHAGLNTDLADPFSAQGEQYLLWDRSGVVDVTKLGHRTVVSGHVTRTLDQISKSLNGNHWQVDNGCYLGDRFPGKGNLVAVDLGTKEMFVQENVDDCGFQSEVLP